MIDPTPGSATVEEGVLVNTGEVLVTDQLVIR